MALKELRKPTKQKAAQIEAKVNKFIAKGGRLATDDDLGIDGDHRLTLRIPKQLMEKIDMKRKKRIGKISRNLWILEVLERATR
jgi:hypothetical protein